MLTNKAVVATVKIGTIEIEGYLLPDGTFGVSLSDLGRLIGIEPKQVRSRILNSKHGKKLTEKGFQGSRKYSVEKSKGSQVQIIQLDWLIPLLQVAARLGIEKSWDLIDDLLGLSLYQLFCDAFGIKFEAEERQQWLSSRQTVKDSFRKSLTDALKAYGYTDSWQYAKFIHAMQQSCGIEDGTRDDLTTKELAHLTAAQSTIGGLISAGFKPEEALQVWIDRN